MGVTTDTHIIVGVEVSLDVTRVNEDYNGFFEELISEGEKCGNFDIFAYDEWYEGHDCTRYYVGYRIPSSRKSQDHDNEPFTLTSQLQQLNALDFTCLTATVESYTSSVNHRLHIESELQIFAALDIRN